MAILHGSVELDVPIQFADQEWTEFVFRALYGSYAQGFADVASSINETDADAGTVTFETEDDRLIRVSVEAGYTPHSGPGADAEVARAQRRLEHDLEKYRLFVLKRCEQESCRSH
jgi:hypothetical protein